MCHLIGACCGISVCHRHTVTRCPVAEVPAEISDLLDARIGDACAGELCFFTEANRCRFKSGRRLGDNDDCGAALVVFNANGNSAGVVSGVIQGAVGDGRVLLCGSEAVGSRPAIGCSSLTNSGQVDGLANAIRAVVVHQGSQNATVGAACANVLEVDVAGGVGKVGDEQDVILSGLCVVDVAVLGGGRVVAAVDHGAARQLVASVVHGFKRPPAVEVNIFRRRTIIEIFCIIYGFLNLSFSGFQ